MRYNRWRMSSHFLARSVGTLTAETVTHEKRVSSTRAGDHDKSKGRDLQER